MTWIHPQCPHRIFHAPEITLKQLFKDSFCSLKSFGIIQNVQQNFWTWVWPPPPFGQCLNAALMLREVILKLNMKFDGEYINWIEPPILWQWYDMANIKKYCELRKVLDPIRPTSSDDHSAFAHISLLFLAPKVLLDYLRPMITIHPSIPSHLCPTYSFEWTEQD